MDHSNSKSNSAFRGGLGLFFILFLATTLLGVVAFCQSPQLIRNARLDTQIDAFFLHRVDKPFFHSPFSDWQGLGRFRLTTQQTISPTLDKSGKDPALFREYESAQYLYLPLGSHADLKLGRRETDAHINYLDSSNYSVDIYSQRHAPSFGLLYHFLRLTEAQSQLDFLIDFQDVELLDYKLGFNWKKGGEKNQGREMHIEGVYALRDGEDSLQFKDLRPEGNGGTGENVNGTYASRLQSLSLLVETRLGPGIWGGTVDYSWSRPTFLQNEYNVTDSSLSMRLGASLSALPGKSLLWYAYEEGRVRTSGLRIPPGSEGSKRFHYALTRTALHEAYLEIPLKKNSDFSSSTLGLSGGYYDFVSQPLKNALGQNKETLSYNRLGLSFLANIFGGFSRNAELIEIDGSIQQLTLIPKHKQKFSSLSFELSAPLAHTELEFNLAGKSVEQGLFKTTTKKTYDYRIAGRMLSVTPRLSGEFKLDQTLLPSWAKPFIGSCQLKLEGKVSQAMILWSDFKKSPSQNQKPAPGPGPNPDPNPGPNPDPNPNPEPVPRPEPDKENTFRAFANGFRAEVNAALEF